MAKDYNKYYLQLGIINMTALECIEEIEAKHVESTGVELLEAVIEKLGSRINHSDSIKKESNISGINPDTDGFNDADFTDFNKELNNMQLNNEMNKENLLKDLEEDIECEEISDLLDAVANNMDTKTDEFKALLEDPNSWVEEIELNDSRWDDDYIDEKDLEEANQEALEASLDIDFEADEDGYTDATEDTEDKNEEITEDDDIFLEESDDDYIDENENAEDEDEEEYNIFDDEDEVYEDDNENGIYSLKHMDTIEKIEENVRIINETRSDIRYDRNITVAKVKESDSFKECYCCGRRISNVEKYVEVTNLYGAKNAMCCVCADNVAHELDEINSDIEDLHEYEKYHCIDDYLG